MKRATQPLGRDVPSLIALSALLVLAAVAFLSLGARIVPLTSIVTALAEMLVGGDGTVDRIDAAIVGLRLPRLLIGIVAGAAMASSGAALQALFRNPLVDPGLIGIASGGALAAATVTVFGEQLFERPSASVLFLVVLQLAAFGGALAAAATVYQLGRWRGQVDSAAMLLAGVAVTAFASAITGVLIYVATDSQLRSLLFWNLGSLGNVSWPHLGVAGVIVPATWWICRHGLVLDALLLGDAPARLLGFEVRVVQRRLIALSALAVGASVAVTGVVAFVGLVVPHLLRPILGASHRTLLPASALLGASLMLVADTVARSVVAPAELPLGVVTSLVGAPFFLWLLRRGEGGGVHG